MHTVRRTHRNAKKRKKTKTKKKKKKKKRRRRRRRRKRRRRRRRSKGDLLEEESVRYGEEGGYGEHQKPSIFTYCLFLLALDGAICLKLVIKYRRRLL